MCLSLVKHMSHLFQLGETRVSPFSIPGSNTVQATVQWKCLIAAYPVINEHITTGSAAN